MYYYRYDLSEKAKNLRRNLTPSESILWEHLRKKQIKNYRFLRQKPLSNYIVDFYCSRLKLIIEVDGKIHEQQVNEDKKRQKALKALGFRFLRFTNDDVHYRIEFVLRTIQEWIENHEKDSPSRFAGHPSKEG